MQDKNTLLRPIRYAIIFSAMTVLLYLFGSYNYPNHNRSRVVIFLIVTNLFMYWGFYFGARYKLIFHRRRYFYAKSRSIHNSKVTFCGYTAKQIINFLFWIALIDCIPKFILFTGAYNMSFSELLSKASLFFSSAQDIYEARQALSSATGIWRYINYFVVLTGPLYWAYTPLALLYWKKLKIGMKIGSIFIWFVFLFQYLVTGTNVGFFDFFLTMMTVSLIKKNFFEKKDATVRKKKPIIMIVIIVIVLFFIFNTVMKSRIGDQYLKGGSLGFYYRYTIDNDSPIWSIVPNSLKAMTAYLTRYLANSYNAVAFAMDMPFKSTYGLGHSWFVLDNIGRGLSKTLWARTYNMQIESAFGFDHYGNWHSAYLWFANDVSFLGVPVLFFFMFYYFGRAWKRFLEEKDLFCFLRFMLFVKMVYFI